MSDIKTVTENEELNIKTLKFEPKTILTAAQLNVISDSIRENIDDISILNDNKQDKLFTSGINQNIKTINGESLLIKEDDVKNINLVNSITLGDNTISAGSDGNANITDAVGNHLKRTYGFEYDKNNKFARKIHMISDINSDWQNNVIMNPTGINVYTLPGASQISNYTENVFEARINDDENPNEIDSEFFENIIAGNDNSYLDFDIVSPKVFNNDCAGTITDEYNMKYADYIYIGSKPTIDSGIVHTNNTERLLHSFIIDSRDKIAEYAFDNIQIAIGYDFRTNLSSNEIGENWISLKPCAQWKFKNNNDVKLKIISVKLNRNTDDEIPETARDITDAVLQNFNSWANVEKSVHNTNPFTPSDSSYENMYLFNGSNDSQNAIIKINYTNGVLNTNDTGRIKIKFYIQIPDIYSPGTYEPNSYFNFVVKFKAILTKTCKDFAYFFKDSVIIKKGKSFFTISDDGVEMRSAYMSDGSSGELPEHADYEYSEIKDCFYGVKVSPHGIFINNGYTNKKYITLDNYVNQQIESSINSAIKKHVADKHT